MTHGRDNRDFRFKNGLGNDFFIECPEVFDASASSSHDQHVCKVVLIKIINRLSNFLGRAFTLDLHGIEHDMKSGKSPGENMQDILDYGAGWARDHTETTGEFGERFFVLRVEPTPRLYLFFELMQFEQQLAHS